MCEVKKRARTMNANLCQREAYVYSAFTPIAMVDNVISYQLWCLQPTSTTPLSHCSAATI